MAKTKSKDDSNQGSTVKTMRGRKPISKANSPPIESNAPVRVGGRMKKAKVVFDPSEHHVPKRREVSNVSHDNDSKTKTSKPTANVSPPSKNKRSRPTSTILTAEATTTMTLVNSTFPVSEIKQEPIIPKREIISPTILSGNSDNMNREIDIDNYYTELCLICLKTGKQNEKMLNCTTDSCNYKAHISCLNLGGDDIDISLLANNWQCPHCKTCVVCFENSDDGALTICSVCEDAYHAICHNPRIPKQSTLITKWKCIHCTRLDDQLKSLPKNTKKLDSSTGTVKSCLNDKIKVEVSSSPEITANNSDEERYSAAITQNIKEEHQDFAGFSDIETTECSSTSNINIINKTEEINTKTKSLKRRLVPSSVSIPRVNLNKKRGIRNRLISNDRYIEIVKDIPDATNWSNEDVYKYFLKYFPNEARIFKEQEIDGASLLLMKRSDVLNGLQLKLGTAIRIYSHIIMLQTRNSDPRLTWM